MFILSCNTHTTGIQVTYTQHDTTDKYKGTCIGSDICPDSPETMNGYKDEDGYVFVMGRMDDVIKVSGYRLGTAEIESALVSHRDVAEAACIGVPDDLRGNVIHAFCILNAGTDGSDELAAELKQHVRHEVGPIAMPAVIEFVDSLPKTRSGKIMRRLLKAQVLGNPLGDTSTLEN